ncbi:MAG: HD-GYP domain-containing protein [Pirellulaceae bacterium]
MPIENPDTMPVATDAVPAGGTTMFRPRRLEESIANIKSSKIMIIDDEPLLVRVVRRFLQSAGYNKFIEVTDSREAMHQINSQDPDLVLLDIMMPHVTGLDILRARQSLTSVQFTPFIILSATSDTDTKRSALELGASEFLNKPLDPSDLTLRVQNALLVKAHQNHLTTYAEELSRQVQLRTAELERSREQIIHCLAKAAEFRDNDTGKHVVRVGKFSSVIADELGFDRTFCRRMELAAQLHDVGKIGVPDSILLNPGKLSDEAFSVMQEHCDLGCSIIEPLARHELEMLKRRSRNERLSREEKQSSLLILAANIAKTHHENWDGTGYPNGLKGNRIPIEGRITAVADVYDALSSHRPYKKAFPLEKCLEIMNEEIGRRFDPKVVEAFLQRLNDIENIRRNFAD